MLKDAARSFCFKVDAADVELLEGKTESICSGNSKPPLVLAGLHACGDLSMTILRTFVECDEIKALVSIGCCYNLLSEEGFSESDSQRGFPVSAGAKSASFILGRNARDLACQSADRWRGLGKSASLHNFELHAFRAAFQMVLYQYYPETITRNLAIGRLGKALRRQEKRRVRESNTDITESLLTKNSIFSSKRNAKNENGSTGVIDPVTDKTSEPKSSNVEFNPIDKYCMFVEFCKSGLGRLGLHVSEDLKYAELWNEAAKFFELVGPYWTLRAALGPVLETLLLLDRLLFLQEQSNIHEAVMLPLFDPVLSPRNVALIAEKM